MTPTERREAFRHYRKAVLSHFPKDDALSHDEECDVISSFDDGDGAAECAGCIKAIRDVLRRANPAAEDAAIRAMEEAHYDSLPASEKFFPRIP